MTLPVVLHCLPVWSWPVLITKTGYAHQGNLKSGSGQKAQLIFSFSPNNCVTIQGHVLVNRSVAMGGAKVEVTPTPVPKVAQWPLCHIGKH